MPDTPKKEAVVKKSKQKGSGDQNYRKYSRDNLEQLANDLRYVMNRFSRQQKGEFVLDITDDDYQNCYVWLLKRINKLGSCNWNTNFLNLKLKGIAKDRMKKKKHEDISIDSCGEEDSDKFAISSDSPDYSEDVRALLDYFINREFKDSPEKLKFAKDVLDFFDDNRYKFRDGELTNDVFSNQNKQVFFRSTNWDKEVWGNQYSSLLMGFRAFMLWVFEKQLSSNRS